MGVSFFFQALVYVASIRQLGEEDPEQCIFALLYLSFSSFF